MRSAPTTLAAIGALFPVRVADAGNSSVAALGNAGTFTGAWKSTAGMARVDIALTVAATTDLIVEHTDSTGAGAEAALTETWPATAATHPTFPTALPRLFYRIRLLDTGGGGAVTLAATLDPRPADHLSPLATTVIDNVATTATTTFAVPIGCRFASLHPHRSGFANAAPDGVYIYTTGAYGTAYGIHPEMAAPDQIAMGPGIGLASYNGNALDVDYVAIFYP
jgi:hypothetical protein